MPEIKPESVALTGLLTISAYSVFKDVMPPITDVRKAKNDPEMAADVRLSEALAVVVTLLGGFAVSSLTGNRAPVGIAAATCAVIVGFYEYALAA